MASQGSEVVLAESSSCTWFHQAMGLNNFGFLPGFPGTNPRHLPTYLLSEDECLARWVRDASGFRYASSESEESPRMQVRIEDLFLLTHQRGMGRNKAIGLASARGIIVEEKGLLIDWAEFATKQCKRNQTADKSFVPGAPKSHAVGDQQRYWIFDEDTKTVKFDYEGASEDWELNKSHGMQSIIAEVQQPQFSSMTVNYKTEIIQRPLYKQGIPWGGKSIAHAKTVSTGGIASEAGYKAELEGIQPINKFGQSFGIGSVTSEVFVGKQPERSTTPCGLNNDVEKSTRIVLPPWKEFGHLLLKSPHKEARKAPAGYDSLASGSREGGLKRKKTDSHLRTDGLHHIPQALVDVSRQDTAIDMGMVISDSTSDSSYESVQPGRIDGAGHHRHE